MKYQNLKAFEQSLSGSSSRVYLVMIPSDQERANAQAKESLQLGIYALYYWKRHKILPDKVTLHFLENGIEGSYEPKEKDLIKLEEKILETAEKIRQDTKHNQFVANPKYFGRKSEHQNHLRLSFDDRQQDYRGFGFLSQ